VPANAAAEPQPSVAPVVVEIVVPCPPDRAFDYFTRDIGRWWPLSTHSLGGEHATDVRFEPREGGRLIERVREGAEHAWGTVTQWRPGERVAFTWHLDRSPDSAQLVEVTFAAHGARTRVTLTHSGWERRDDGTKARDNYARGWTFVLGDRYRDFCANAWMRSSLARG